VADVRYRSQRSSPSILKSLTGIISWVLLLVPRATHFTGYWSWFTWGLGQHTLLGIDLGLRGASGNTLYWVLLLVYVGLGNTRYTGYCCWFTWGLGQHTLLGIVGLRGASDNTLYWVLLLAYVWPRATHFIGYCWWFMWGPLATHFIDVGLCEVSDITLNWASLFVCYGSSAMGLK
jgi:hypothetical protein